MSTRDEIVALLASGEPIVVVDELQQWGVATDGLAGVHFRAGRPSCHMTVIGELDALHAFALKIGLRREWFQAQASWPHYDLTAGKRAQALRHGAVFIPARTQVMAERPARVLLRMLPTAARVEAFPGYVRAAWFAWALLGEGEHEEGGEA